MSIVKLLFAAVCLIAALFCEICVCELFNSQQQRNLVFVKSNQITGVRLHQVLGYS